MDQTLFSWVVIPLLIIIARIFDVSIGTLRIIFIARGYERVGAILGFFEVIIWLCAISQVMKNLSNVACYLAYGAGFGLGTLIGGAIEKRLAVGVQVVQIITDSQLESLQMVLRDEGYGVTTIQGHGGKGAVNIIYVVTQRKQVQHVLHIVNSIEPKSFVTVQAIDRHMQGFFTKNNHFKQSIVK
ncbi:MAG: DUF2179 domain-containing protein [Chitinivibrionales bacterium]|nr:DUF2179 domain-containing protein [Chitinivibrionales bacterium]